MTDGNAPDRTNVSKDAWDLIAKIDKSKFCHLDTSETNRTDLYCYAMSLGVDTSCRKKISAVHQGGLILDKSLGPRCKALMFALSIYDADASDFASLEAATDKAHVFTLSDEYANEGFYLLKDEMDKSKEDQDYLWKTLKEIDKMYKKYFEEE